MVQLVLIFCVAALAPSVANCKGVEVTPPCGGRFDSMQSCITAGQLAAEKIRNERPDLHGWRLVVWRCTPAGRSGTPR